MKHHKHKCGNEELYSTSVLVKLDNFMHVKLKSRGDGSKWLVQRNISIFPDQR